jgi:hypothetical protein
MVGRLVDLNAVADEIVGRLKTAFEPRGFYIHPQPAESLTPPALIVSYPKTVEYDETYGRGMDKVTDWEILAATGAVSEFSARKRLLQLAGGGLAGVKAVLEAPGQQSFDEIRVSSASFDVFTMAGVDYVSCTWLLDIWGTGRA